jgi:acetylornithine/succinyldiaminopimelate/putrescine aminotransferase
LIVNAVDDHAVRLVPPLIIDGAQIERAHSVMRQAMK